MNVESGFVELSDTRLHYESHGAGRPILLVHGFTLDRRMWNRQVAALSAGHRVVVVDTRGHGLSAMPTSEPYLHCEDLACLCEKLGLEQVLAVGHSIGAHQTLELALTRPDLVAGWAGVCTSGLAGTPFPDDVTQLFGRVRAAARDESIRAAKAHWAAGGWFAVAREVPALARELDQMLADYTGWHWRHENPVRNIDPPAAERLSSLRVPALVITGERDLEYNARVGRALLEGLPRARSLRVPRAGHMANMEAPESVSHALGELAVTL